MAAATSHRVAGVALLALVIIAAANWPGLRARFGR